MSDERDPRVDPRSGDRFKFVSFHTGLDLNLEIEVLHVAHVGGNDAARVSYRERYCGIPRLSCQLSRSGWRAWLGKRNIEILTKGNDGDDHA
jgi:hypothetical protein